MENLLITVGLLVAILFGPLVIRLAFLIMCIVWDVVLIPGQVLNFTTLYMDHQKETKRVYNACIAYWELSKVLFGGKDSIIFINNLPKDSPFYNDAMDIAEEMGVAWDKMTIEQSDAITLGLLETLFLRIRSKSRVDVVVDVKLYGTEKNNGNPKGKGRR